MNPTPSTPAETQAVPDPTFILVFNKLPAFDIGLIADGIRACEPLKQDVTYQLDGESDAGFVATVMFDDHQIQLAGLPVALPKSVVEQSVNSSKYHPKLTKEIIAHQAHIVCFYQGNATDPVEQLMALEKVALAFLPLGVLGLIDSGAWNCRPRVLMEKFSIKLLRGALEGEPHMVSLGFVKFIKDDGVWFCTKGQHRFGLPDFAWFAKLNEAQAIYDAFGKLFLQLRASGTPPKPGDTAMAGDGVYVRFREVYEYGDWLNGPAGTLVVERTNEAEARTGGPTGAGALHENRDQVVFIKDGDEAMELAFQLAQDSMKHFWDVFANPQNGEEGFCLKVRISDGYGTEQFWVGDIEQKGEKLFGRINNDPNVVKSVKSGQRVPLPPEEITDWLYMRNRKMVGNFTARALVRTMPPAEAKKYHAMMSDFFPLKVNCGCGQHFAFEVEAPSGQMPYAIACPACNADGTALANAQLTAIIHGKVTGPASETKAPGKLSLSASAKSSAPPPPAVAARPSAPPRPTNSSGTNVLLKIGAIIGGVALLLIIGVAALVFHFKPKHPAPPNFPAPPSFPTYSGAPKTPGNNASSVPSTYVGAPIPLKNRLATFTDLQGNEYKDVHLTMATSHGLNYFLPGVRSGVIPYTNLPTEFLIELGVHTNWAGVLK